MGEQGHFVGGLDNVVGSRERAERIPDILSQHPRRLSQGTIVAVELFARDTRIGAAIPGDLQLVTGLLRTPIAIGQYHNTGSDRFGFDDARHSQGLAGIKIND